MTEPRPPYRKPEKLKAEDLGPSAFDPNAPYQPIDPYAPPHHVYEDNLPVSTEESSLAMLAHLSGLIGAFMASLPAFIGPLVIWLWKRDTSHHIEINAREALNFQITILLVTAACFAVAFVSCGVGLPLLLVPFVLQVVFGLIATLATSKGQSYRYPINLRLIK